MLEMKGLNSEDVNTSREKYGSNAIPEPEPTTFWEEFKETFSDPMIKILVAIAVLMFGMFCFGYAEIYESIGTITAILIVAFVSAKTNVSSDTKYRALKNRTEKEKCKVFRNGDLIEINVDDVVVNDLILLQSGDKIPADGILVDGDLSVDNSALNGETEECKKIANVEAILPEKITGNTFVDESSLFRGSIVYDGKGVCLVKRVGLTTMMGQMAAEMQEDEPESPLKVKLKKLAAQCSKFGYAAAISIALLYIILGVVQVGGITPFFSLGVSEVTKRVVSAISKAVVIVVCAVPEGLPLMIALVLMQNTSKMLDHNVLVRKATGIETAGALNILFSDKTGTITKGHLQVVEFLTGDGITRKIDTVSTNLQQLFYKSIAKNTQSFINEQGDIIGGNVTDQALVAYLGKSVLDSLTDVEVGENQNFNSTNKFSQAVIEGKVFYKGAPERLLAKATKYLDSDGKVVELDLDKLNNKIDILAGRAIRVLAFGYSESEFKQDNVNDDIVLIGLVGIRDEVRPEAKKAIKEVKDAGIQVVMITGDKLETASAIAREAELLESSDDLVISSAELNNMTDDEVKTLIPKIRVIARALPTDKSRMIRLCQEMNLVVGMTGDGVNDSPALKRADVGFAMGSGTEAAKEAGKIVILDDNFKSIKDAILYGRTIYHNILKFCTFQLTINVAAVIVNIIALFFGIEEPLKVTHLLFVNLVMDGLGAMMLGNEPAKMEYLKEKPRRRDESIINREMIGQIAVAGLWLSVMSIGFLKIPFFINIFNSEEQHLTAYFVLFIWTALANGFNVRDNGIHVFKGLSENPDFLKVLSIIVLVQAILVNAALLPFAPAKWISSMFSCTPFGVLGWIVVAVLSLSIIPIDLARKSLMRRKCEGI